MSFAKITLSTAALIVASAFGAAPSAAVGAPNTEPMLINGAGATFPFPLYSKWIAEYKKADPSTEINYHSIGSGGGVRQLLDQTVDFGASDAPMTDDLLAKAKSPVLHIPTVLGAVVIVYNLPGVTTPLKMTAAVIADIFMGKIQKWDDNRIAAINPGVTLPKMNIIPAYRSDGSGTTAVFTDYLSKVSPAWKTTVGHGTAVKWPVGIGGKGNEGVTALVRQPGRIGYVELIYAKQNKLQIASVQNKAGQFVDATIESVSTAAKGALSSIPKDFRISITDAAGKGSYPIASFTYLIVYQEINKARGERLVKFLNWAMADGQKLAPALEYSPLPKELVTKVSSTIKSIKLTP